MDGDAIRLTPAPDTFQRLMNDVSRRLLDICVVDYLDYILVFSESMEVYPPPLIVRALLTRQKLFARKSK